MSTAETAAPPTSKVFAAGSVTVTGLKEKFGIGRSVAYELMNSGKLLYTQINRRRLIPRSAVKALLATGLVGAA